MAHGAINPNGNLMKTTTLLLTLTTLILSTAAQAAPLNASKFAECEFAQAPQNLEGGFWNVQRLSFFYAPGNRGLVIFERPSMDGVEGWQSGDSQIIEGQATLRENGTVRVATQDTNGQALQLTVPAGEAPTVLNLRHRGETHSLTCRSSLTAR